MTRLFIFSRTYQRDPAIEDWLKAHADELGVIARHWFEIMRGCGKDVREILHDGHPTACVGETAFAYVDAFSAHINVGFFHGAELVDPAFLLDGTGKFMRHVKVRPKMDMDEEALRGLIETAYADMQNRLRSSAG